MTEEDFRSWDGWVHSRIRQLIMKVQATPWQTFKPQMENTGTVETALHDIASCS